VELHLFLNTRSDLFPCFSFFVDKPLEMEQILLSLALDSPCNRQGRGDFRALAMTRYSCSEKVKTKMKIYVGNMPFSMGEDALRDMFSKFGEVDSVNVITDRDTSRPRGFAFVEMEETEAARKAISALSGQEVDGRNLNVNEARPRENRGDGGRRGGGRRGGGGRW
jgi:cold-inducible RNA-binding protein